MARKVFAMARDLRNPTKGFFATLKGFFAVWKGMRTAKRDPYVDIPEFFCGIRYMSEAKRGMLEATRGMRGVSKDGNVAFPSFRK